MSSHRSASVFVPSQIGLSPSLDERNLYLNDGNGGFLPPVAFSGPGYLQIARIADRNGDGNPGIAACYINYGRSVDIGTGEILFNDGTGKFTVRQSLTLSNNCAGMVVGTSTWTDTRTSSSAPGA